jgi:hypothetical protein
MVEQYHAPAVHRAIDRYTTPNSPDVHVLFAVTDGGFGLFEHAYADAAEAEAAWANRHRRPSYEWPEGIVDYTVETFYR